MVKWIHKKYNEWLRLDDRGLQAERHWKPGGANETDGRQVWGIHQCGEEQSITGEEEVESNKTQTTN